MSDEPIIGYDNIVTTSNITAGTADADYPVTNLANPSTASEWRGSSATLQYLTVLTGSAALLGYLGVARHNFGSQNITVSVEARVTGGATAFTQICAPVSPDDDSPLFFTFTATAYFEVRLKMTAGDAAPRAAVLYLGTLLTMERGIYVGHTPLKYGRRTINVSGVAETGDFLGRVVTGEYRESTAKFSLISAAFYRASIEPFLIAAQENPFFFAWRPTTYPLESGFAVLINDPQPVPTEPSHLIEIELQMRGVP